MYQMTRTEFRQYDIAEKQLLRIKEEHRLKLLEVYAGIHPTRTCYDYELNRIYVESVNPEDYASYLVDLQMEQKQAEDWWQSRAELYREGIKRLSAEERAILKSEDYKSQKKVKDKLRVILSELLNDRPDLQRASSLVYDDLESMEDADQLIESLSEEELLEDYIDYTEKEDSPPKISGCLISLEEKRELNVSPVAEWTMSEEERVEYVAKYPVIRRSKEYYETRWLG